MAKKDKSKKLKLPQQLLDDVTFIQEMKHGSCGPWHQYDILLAARGYGWDMMLDWADYVASADLDRISQVAVGQPGLGERDITAAWRENGGKLRGCARAEREMGLLSIAGMSRGLRVPMKIVWFNQTRVLRLFTLTEDEELVTRYAETLIRRSFGGPDAMKRAKPIPEKK